jgi:hypothetical protein
VVFVSLVVSVVVEVGPPAPPLLPTLVVEVIVFVAVAEDSLAPAPVFPAPLDLLLTFPVVCSVLVVVVVVVFFPDFNAPFLSPHAPVVVVIF